MLSQDGIDEKTPLGATLSPDGATFKLWAPFAKAVYLNGAFAGAECEKQTDARLLAKDAFGFWTGFQPGARDGDRYRYFVVGEGGADYRRDPTARELDPAADSKGYAILRRGSAYPWHDADFVTPDFSAMVVYQAHIGTFATRTEGRSSNLLEAACLSPYLARLGVNVLQPLPGNAQPAAGHGGADLFSTYAPLVASAEEVERLTPEINAILAAKGFEPLPAGALASAHNQVKALVDLCHIHGVAVVFDVICPHESLAFTGTDNGAGDLAFAHWKEQVRRFLHENARFYAQELHADGLRYDEIGILLSASHTNGWTFRALGTGVRSHWPIPHDAEFGAGAFGDAADAALPIVAPVTEGGAALDVAQHDVLRSRIRDAIHAASWSGHGPLPMSGVAAALSPSGFDRPWRMVTCVENHDLVHVGRQQRIAALADAANRRSWYARSRARVAMGLLMTAPGIPQLFMGQEFLEDKQWNRAPVGDNLLWWEGFEGADKAMSDHWRCTADLIALRRDHESLRGDQVNAFYVNDNDRIMAFHRWIEGVGEDVVVVVSLAEFTRYDYRLGMPGPGVWREIFNSDAYDNMPNPWVAGNGGALVAGGAPMHGLPASAAFVLPANSVLVLSR